MTRNIREPIPHKGYIRFLAMRPIKDEYGNEHLCVDEDMKLHL